MLLISVYILELLKETSINTNAWYSIPEGSNSRNEGWAWALKKKIPQVEKHVAQVEKYCVRIFTFL